MNLLRAEILIDYLLDFKIDAIIDWNIYISIDCYCQIKYLTRFGDLFPYSKKTWEIINQLRGKSKKSIKPCFLVDGILVLQRRVIATKFNQYFASIASKLNDDTADIVQNMPTDYRQFMPTPTPNSIFFSDCTEYEVEQIINKLENGKSSDFPIRVIKKLSNILTPVLTAHFNSAMTEGTFPSILTIG